MADRMRSLAKRSGSKLSIAKGSMNHIGTTPFKYRIDIFVSYVDGIKSSTDVCVTLERRGKTESTPVVKVKDKKAIVKHTLSLDTTLFRKGAGSSKSGEQPAPDENAKFDEKIAKIALRKGGPDGKAIGKIHLNLSDHVKGPANTVFADLKLNNDAVVVTKIESKLLHAGKRKGNSSTTGSEQYSEMTEVDTGMENDSIFGDGEDGHGDLDLLIDDAGVATRSGSASDHSSPGPQQGSTSFTQTSGAPLQTGGGSSVHTSENVEGANQISRDNNSISSRETSLPETFQQRPSAGSDESNGEPKKDSRKNALSKEGKRENTNAGPLAESPSLRDKIKSRIKGDKSQPRKSRNKEGRSKREEAARTGGDWSKTGGSSNTAAVTAEVAELKTALAALQDENKRLRASKQAMMEEIEALRAELDSVECASDGPTSFGKLAQQQNGGVELTRLRRENTELSEKVRELEGQVEGLLDELDARNDDDEEQGTGEPARGGSHKYRKRIEELEVALRREPQYLDVVNELKVTKMALALANMEKEQAIFALRQYETASKARLSQMSPMSQASASPPSTPRTGLAATFFG